MRLSGSMQCIAKGAVGFSLAAGLSEAAMDRLKESEGQALGHFPWLEVERLEQGATVVDIWAHNKPERSISRAADGTLSVLIGSPMNDVSWEQAQQQLQEEGDDRFEIPWEGRCILIRISPDGTCWTIWNDWVGSIPVFYACVQGARIASSLEPVVVGAGGFSPDQFSRRGLLELLIHGHFLGTDTLYRDMHVLPPDSVSHWTTGGFGGSKRLWTVGPSGAQNEGWDRLVSEMHKLTVESISSALTQCNKWLLPLSGGMDSRLIACVGRDVGADVDAYTYGPKQSYEVRCARKLAQVLDIRWRWVDQGVDFLAEHTSTWLDWFGSSLHAHGMYQMPLLTAVRSAEGRMMGGFCGNNMAGGDHPSSGLLNGAGSVWRRFYGGYHGHWSLEGLRSLVNFDIEPVLGGLKAVLAQQECLVSRWPYYQRMNAIDMWNRQRRFVSYQPTMYDYWKGVSEPYMHRDYARFCLSLPRPVLEGRQLQREVLTRFWPEAAAVPGTSDSISLVERGRRKAARTIASRLPYGLLYDKLRNALAWPNNLPRTDCIKARGWHSLYPITPRVLNSLPKDGYLDSETIQDTCHRAIAGDRRAHRKLLPLQTVIHRMIGG